MNNLLKSIFVSVAPVFALAVAIFSIWQIIQAGISWAYVGNALMGTAIAAYFIFIFINKRPRTDRNLKGYGIPAGFGFVVAAVGVIQGGSINAFMLSVSLLLIWVLFLQWYSVFENRKETTLQVGMQLPDFELQDAAKQLVSSSQFKGKPAIFLFYRGNWCPLCMAQIKEIANDYQELEKRGVQTILVSPQPHKYTANLARKFKVGFQFLVDEGNKVAKQLQLLSPNGIPFGFQALGYDSDTVLPTVIITDKQGKIIFLDLTDNYRIRPEPSTFLRALDQHASSITE